MRKIMMLSISFLWGAFFSLLFMHCEKGGVSCLKEVFAGGVFGIFLYYMFVYPDPFKLHIGDKKED